MFSLFKKKTPAYPSSSKWSLLNGAHDGKPMFLRRNDSAIELLRHPEYRYRVGVAAPLLAPNEDGLPSSDEMEQLNSIEDVLSAQLEENQQSLQVLVITTGGMREFVFYTKDPIKAKVVIETLRTQVTTHKIQGYITEDPEWQLFKQFA